MDTELARHVTDWIAQTAKAEHIAITIYPEGISLDGKWLHVPVSVDQGEDAYDRASLLQQIEDV